jgi:hypothetical protein
MFSSTSQVWEYFKEVQSIEEAQCQTCGCKIKCKGGKNEIISFEIKT